VLLDPAWPPGAFLSAQDRGGALRCGHRPPSPSAHGGDIQPCLLQETVPCSYCTAPGCRPMCGVPAVAPPPLTPSHLAAAALEAGGLPGASMDAIHRYLILYSAPDAAKEGMLLCVSEARRSCGAALMSTCRAVSRRYLCMLKPQFRQVASTPTAVQRRTAKKKIKIPEGLLSTGHGSAGSARAWAVRGGNMPAGGLLLRVQARALSPNSKDHTVQTRA